MNLFSTRGSSSRTGLWAAAVVLVLAGSVALDVVTYDATAPAGAHADAAIVLGAAVWDRDPSPVFAARLDYAATLVLEGAVERVLLTGGTRDSLVVAESEVGRRYLIDLGVPNSLIVTESSSRTTWQNLACIAPAVEGSVLVVSDPLHLRRAMSMARDLSLDARPAATPTSRYRSLRSKAGFLARETFFRFADAVAEVTRTRGACPD